MSLIKRYEKFFAELGASLSSPLTIILTGGAAAHLMGGDRPTDDLDFSIQPGNKKGWAKDAEIMEKLSQKHELPLQYGEDISRWSMISLLDWREHTLPYAVHKKLTVRLLHPKYWSIGKVSRGWGSDFSDLVTILKKKKLSVEEMVPFWAKAFLDSEPSSELYVARKQVEDFLKKEGSKVWGDLYDPNKALELFRNSLKKKK